MFDDVLKKLVEGVTHTGQRSIIGSELDGRDVPLFVHAMIEEDNFPEELLEKAARTITEKELDQAGKELAAEKTALERAQEKYKKK